MTVRRMTRMTQTIRMTRMTRVAALGAGALATSLAAGPAPALAAPASTPARNPVHGIDIGRGPTTDVLPYVLPVAPAVGIQSLLTVGDRPAGNGYRLAGTPDGFGAYRRDGRAILEFNHEFTPDKGIVRAHGQKGSFVSRLVMDPQTDAIRRGRDLIERVRYWDYPAGRYSATPQAPNGTATAHTAAFARFCSSSLTEARQLYNARTGRGYRGRLYFGNEENGDEGRNFAVTMKGTASQLPRLGLFSWENTNVATTSTDRTVTIGNEDGSEGQLWVYSGRKTRSGSAVDRAGLTNGTNYVIDVVEQAVSTDAEYRARFGKGKSVPVRLSSVDWNASGAAQNAAAKAKGLSLNRIEDGAFDPRNRNAYYFTTTEGGSTADSPAEPGVKRDGGGLWRLTFRDVDRPELGAKLTLLLDGTEAPYLNKPDNLTVDSRGNVLIQEDPGGNDHVARIVAYRIKDGARGVLARFDRGLFGVSNPAGTTPDERAVLTTDEESSGILDASRVLGRANTFLFTAQVHTPKALPTGTGPGTVEEYVERGQLLTMTVRNWNSVYRIKR